MKIWWVEQRYVFPVYAETFEDAENFAFKKRALIAEECGPVETRPHRVNSLRSIIDREGWDISGPSQCDPYKEEE